jgi:hypothetical protein
MLCSSTNRRRSNHHLRIPNLLFFWCRPIGADDAVRRFTVVVKSKSSTSNTASVWAKPLSYLELLDTIKGEGTMSNYLTLEICGVEALTTDCWDEICLRLSLWKKPIRQVLFLSSYLDDYVAKLVSSVSIVSLCLQLDGGASGRSWESDPDGTVSGYTKILKAASNNKALRELIIQRHSNVLSPSLQKQQPPTKLSHTDCEIIMKGILPRLQRLELPSSILRDGHVTTQTGVLEQKLIDYAENHLHCVISIKKQEDDECCVDIYHDYLEWHNQIHWYRLSLLKAMVTAQRISRSKISIQRDTIRTVDAGIRVLKDWFRTTHAQRRTTTRDNHHHHHHVDGTATRKTTATQAIHTTNRKEQDNQ